MYVEYVVIGREVYGIKADGSEHFVMRCEDQAHAEEKAAALNAKL